MAGGETGYEAGFERAGIIRCNSIEQQFNYAEAFASQPLPAGNNVVVITNAGGPGIMAADAIEREGLGFAKLTQATMDKLASVLPAAANIHNPVDVLGDALADRYEFALDTVLDDPGVDIALVVLTPQAMTECSPTAEAIVRGPQEAEQNGAGLLHRRRKNRRRAENSARRKHPAIFCAGRRGGRDQSDDRARALAHKPKRVVKLFPVNRHKVEIIIERHIRQGMREVGESDAKEILDAYGFATPKGALATTPEQAANIADQIGYPVVLKIWSQDIIHKSDVGGVKLGLRNAQEVMDAFDLMMYRIPRKVPQAQILGVFVQQMCKGVREVILGMNRDPRFGPLMMFGMGGTMVEVMKDVSFYLAPLTADEAKQMLMGTRTYKMLQGVRGEEGVDIDAIAEGLQRLSQLVTEFPQIQELDINPYVVGPQGTVPIAVDARMSVEKES